MSRKYEAALRGLLLFLAAVAAVACGEVALEPNPGEDDAHDLLPRVHASADAIVERWERTGGFYTSPSLEAPAGATRVAFQVDLRLERGDAEPWLEARGLRDDGTWTDWLPAEETWREAPYAVARVDFDEVVTAVEVRLAESDAASLQGLVFEAVIPLVSDEEADDGVELAPEGRAARGLAGFLQALVRSRAVWGARPTRCTSQNSSKHRMAVHHTVTPTTYAGTYAARVRQIQAFHMDGRGWCDVGYHFLVTADGTVWEGRPLHLLGAHLGGHNTGNIGVSFVGCFHSSGCGSMPPNRPPQAMIDGGRRSSSASRSTTGSPGTRRT